MSHLTVISALLLILSGPALGTDFIPLEKIDRGMKGYGLTVFQDSRIDTFQVEVVGVQQGVRADGSLILVEVSGHDLERSSIAQGMSGSPIFIEGRFAGALAFGWGGALRPLAGVTPAREILGLPTWMKGDPHASLSSPGDAMAAVPAGTQPFQALTSLIPPGAGLALAEDLGLPASEASAHEISSGDSAWPRPEELIVSLMADALGEKGAPRPGTDSPWLLRPLGRQATGGSGAEASPSGTLEPGSACAIPLVMGDALLGAIGTVTWVDGKDVYMMGHPFMQRGPVRLPLASAHIHTIFPSRQLSFKLGSVGEVIGTVNHDQRAGVTGRLGPGPEMIPVDVEWNLAGPDGSQKTHRYHFDVADDIQLGGPLVFWALYNSLLVAGDDASMQNVAYEISLNWESRDGDSLPPVEWSGVTAGPGGVARLAADWMAPINAMLNNPFQAARLTSVTARMATSRPVQAARISGLSVPRTLAPGSEMITGQIELTPWHGEPRTLDLNLALPADLPAGNYRLAVASAAEIFALEAQRAPGSLQAHSVEKLTQILGQDRSGDVLVATLFSPGKGLMLDSREWSGLPGRVSRLLKSGNMEIKPVMADVVGESRQETDWLLMGHAVRNIKVTKGPEIVPQKRRP